MLIKNNIYTMKVFDIKKTGVQICLFNKKASSTKTIHLAWNVIVNVVILIADVAQFLATPTPFGAISVVTDVVGLIPDIRNLIKQ